MLEGKSSCQETKLAQSYDTAQKNIHKSNLRQMIKLYEKRCLYGHKSRMILSLYFYD